ncbi:hypothetical protein MRP92_04290 [Flavobacterium covae]|uniref:hypothetical protein n=1 Tax=Flavobacterium covae TaxID=2906076 RepID=UPI001FB6D741|nr:hypothetical protein [Flavobacterium covae]MCJ1806133.1 hypothetical protein [Flavobacterium covae]
MSFYQEEERIINICGVKVSNMDYSIDHLTHKVTDYKSGRNAEEEKELKKLFFINDKVERLEKINLLICNEKKKHSAHNDYILQSIITDIEPIQILKKNSIDVVFQISQYASFIRKYGKDMPFNFIESCLKDREGMSFDQLDWIIEEGEYNTSIGAELFRFAEKKEEIRRIWVLELYIEKIIQTAKSISNSDKYKAICYLIDEQYKIHKNVVCGTIEDIFLRAHINYIIFEAIEIYLNNIDSEATEKTKELIPQRKYEKKNLLKWNSKKSAIGTLFGVLHKEGIIQGSKADLARELAKMFGNLSESTLIDNIGLKEDKENYKPKYDTETEELMSKWVTFLKSCTPKQG